MGFDDDEEENACDRDLDESQEAQTSNKKKYNDHKLIFLKNLQKLDNKILLSCSMFDMKYLNENKNNDLLV